MRGTPTCSNLFSKGNPQPPRLPRQNAKELHGVRVRTIQLCGEFCHTCTTRRLNCQACQRQREGCPHAREILRHAKPTQHGKRRIETNTGNARQHGTLDGQVAAFFVMVVAAAEVTIGLAIIVSIYRTRRTTSVDDANLLKA